MKNMARVFVVAGCVLGSASVSQAGIINVNVEGLGVGSIALELESSSNALMSQLVSIQPGTYEDELSAVVAAGPSTFAFRSAGTFDSIGAPIDNAQVTSVPDAGVTAALFGIALAGLGCFRKMAR